MENQICMEYYKNTLPNLHSDVTKQTRPIYLIYGIVLYVVVIVGFLAFVATKNRIIYSKQKKTIFPLTSMVGTLMLIFMYTLREYVGRENIPCQVLAWVYHMPMVFVASLPVGNMFFYIYRLRKERMKTQLIKKMFNEDIETQSQLSFDSHHAGIFHKQKEASVNMLSEIIDFLFVWRFTKNGRIVTSKDEDDRETDKDMKPATEIDASHNMQLANTTSGIASNSTGKENAHSFKQVLLEELLIPLLILILFGFPYPIAIALRVYLDPLYNAGCYGCALNYVDFFMKLACGGIYVPMVILGIYAMRNEPDPLKIFYELKVALLWGSVTLACILINAISSLYGLNDRAILNAIEASSSVGIYYTFVMSAVVSWAIETRRWRLQNERSKVTGTVTSISNVISKDQEYSVKNLPPANVIDLNRLLQEPKARNVLLEHAVNEISSENIVFVFKVRAWKAMHDREKAEKVTKVAMSLFNEYISKDSKAPINIPYKMYSKLEQDLEACLSSSAIAANPNRKSAKMVEESGNVSLPKPSKDIFDECENECVSMIEHGTLPRFLRSEVFKKEIVEAGLLNRILIQ